MALVDVSDCLLEERNQRDEVVTGHKDHTPVGVARDGLVVEVRVDDLREDVVQRKILCVGLVVRVVALAKELSAQELDLLGKVLNDVGRKYVIRVTLTICGRLDLVLGHWLLLTRNLYHRRVLAVALTRCVWLVRGVTSEERVGGEDREAVVEGL